MTWLKASELEEGMRCCHGLTVTHIDKSPPLVHLTFSGFSEGKREHEFTYHPSQLFDIAQAGERGSHMAQRVNIEILSDLSEKPDASTVSFGFDGTDYTIDLTEQEHSKFREVMAKYVGAGTPVSKRKGGRKATNGTTPHGPSAKVIREWAQSQEGLEVPDRGRIPEDVRAAYNAAH